MKEPIKSPANANAEPELLSKNSKKLGMYFVESDNRRSPFAGGYTSLGTTPVNIRGKPITDLSKTGGWLAAFFIFGNEMAERMAYFGLSVNMVAFMFYVMHRPFTSSANAVNNFLGISQASSVLGGFIADAYLGRYWTIAIFTTIYLLGLTGITLCATLNVLVPKQDDCSELSLLLGNCEPAKPWQMYYLYTVLYVTGFGAAGIRPCVSSFGADQFDEKSRDYNSNLDRFFNFFYLSVTLGAIIAFTAVVYIQMELGWGFAFGALAIAMGISNIVFFLGTPLYRHRLPGGSPLTRVAQVLVAAFRKRNASFDASEYVGLYELQGKRCAIKGSAKIPHTDDFRCLDKAALRLKEDETDMSPWKLCTVTQVEEVKILLKLIPIPTCTIMLSVVLTEYLTLSVQQAYTLNTYMGHFKLPVTCMPVFPGLSIFLLLSLYYTVFVPISRRITGHPRGASQLQRVGLGLAISILSVGWAAIFERYRRNYAIREGYEGSFLSPMPGLSAYWLLIQYCLIGLAEVFSLQKKGLLVTPFLMTHKKKSTDKHIIVSSLLLPKPYTPMAELERLFWGANLFWRGRIGYLFGVKSGTISSMDFHRTSYFSNSRLQSSIVDDGGTLLRYLAKILAPEGSKNVAVGQAIAITVEDPADVELLKSYGSGNMAAKEAKPAPPASHDKEVKVQKSSFARISPSAKLLIAQHKLDASSIMASGAHGTLLKSDVLTAIKSGTGATKSSSSEPKTTSSSQSATHTSLSSELQQSDSYEDLPNTQIRKVIARRLLESKQSIPHLYLTTDVILDPLLTFRKELKAMINLVSKSR